MSFDQCLDENGIVPSDRRQEIKGLLRKEKYSKLVIRTESSVLYAVRGAEGKI